MVRPRFSQRKPSFSMNWGLENTRPSVATHNYQQKKTHTHTQNKLENTHKTMADPKENGKNIQTQRHDSSDIIPHHTGAPVPCTECVCSHRRRKNRRACMAPRPGRPVAQAQPTPPPPAPDTSLLPEKQYILISWYRIHLHFKYIATRYIDILYTHDT